MIVRKATKEDFNKLVPFMNKAFHKKFPKILPKLYTTDEICSSHVIAEENGKILGTVASIPVDLHLKNDIVKCSGVGMVSTHKKARGKGIMNTLMSTVVSEAKQNGIELMFLSGNRQRYERYGFVPSGAKLEYNFYKHNLSYIPDDDNIVIDKGINSSDIDTLIEIYDQSKIRYDRNNFEKTLYTWRAKPFTVKYGGSVIGYGVMARFKLYVREITVKKEYVNIIPSIVKSVMKKYSMPIIIVECAPWNIEQAEQLNKYANDFGVKYADDYCILNYRSVIEKYLNSTCGKIDGSINLKIETEVFNVTVKNDVAIVSATDKTADVTFATTQQANVSLFSFMTPYVVENELLKSWFSSVNLFMTSQDNV